MSPTRLGSAMISLLAALVVALLPVAEAQAVKTGGRIGSSAPSRREQRAPPTSREAAPRVINKTTVVEKTKVVVQPAPPPVVVAPPPVIGYPAPVLVAPAPTLGDVIVGAAVSSAISSATRGPTTTDRIMENQMRQDERQLDRQAAQIDNLQRELQALKK